MEERDKQIVEMYVNLSPAVEIAPKFGLTVRQIQRILNKAGVMRTRSESYRLAIKQGRMKYYRKPEHLKVKRVPILPHLRAKVMQRDKYRCQYCGNTTEQGIRLEIDHIDNDATNNKEDNLQVLCNLCNRGKAELEGAYSHRDRWIAVDKSK